MTESSSITVSRCRDCRIIERLLISDYYDSPICYFPRRLTRAAARWIAKLDAFYFVTAECSGQHAGYVFAHTLGPYLWRTFAKRHLHLLPHIALVFLRKRLRASRARHSAKPRNPASDIHPTAAPGQVSQIKLERVDQSFEWSPADSKTAFVDMIHVSKQFRGQGIAAKLLREVLELVTADGVSHLEAHVDATNHASIRTFQKAGWNVVQTSTGDCKAEFFVELDNKR